MAKFNAISLLFVSVILSMINMPHIVYTERLHNNLGVSLGLLSLGNLLNNRNNNQPNIIPVPIPVPVPMQSAPNYGHQQPIIIPIPSQPRIIQIPSPYVPYPYSHNQGSYDQGGYW